jgi:hypothetical protein
VQKDRADDPDREPAEFATAVELPRMIEFELWPADMRAFETWAQLKLLASSAVSRAAIVVLPVVGFVVGLRHPRLLPFSDDINVILLALLPQWSLIAAFLVIRQLVLRRFRRAAALVEGQHSTHFSAAGVHHVGPLGTRRYGWSMLRDVQLTVGYVFFRFAGEGSVAVPIDALRKAFGDLDGMPDEAFLNEIVPLISEGVADAER